MQGHGVDVNHNRNTCVRLIRQDRREVHAMASDLEHLSLLRSASRTASWEHTMTPVQDSMRRLCAHK